MNKRKLLAIALAGLLLTACAKRAADTKQPGSTGDSSEPPRIASTAVVKVTPAELTLAKGESGYADVQLQIQGGYHINANPPSFSYLIGTELSLAPTTGISVDFVKYPDGVTKKFSFAEEPLKVYEGETTVKAMLSVKPPVDAGKHNLSGKLRVQACDDQVCYPPGTIDVTIPVTVK